MSLISYFKDLEPTGFDSNHRPLEIPSISVPSFYPRTLAALLISQQSCSFLMRRTQIYMYGNTSPLMKLKMYLY